MSGVATLNGASASHLDLDLGRAPYALYGIECIDLVCLGLLYVGLRPVAHTLTWVVRPYCYASYGINYIDLLVVSLYHNGGQWLTP